MMELYRNIIGKRIQEIRIKKRLTQAELAALANIDQGNISKIEKGRYNITVELLARIADALGCRVDLIE